MDCMGDGLQACNQWRRQRKAGRHATRTLGSQAVLGKIRAEPISVSVYGHLSKTEREEPSARRLLDSIAQFYPKPWVRPFDKCMGAKDAREVSMWKFDYVHDMAVCWAKEYIVIATSDSIIVWSMSRNERLNTIICEAWSIALSADGQQIVGGCVDGTVRRWDLHTGESIGEPLRGHEDVVRCVAISADG
eukprot:IDg858t1